jgi:diguanylate cyclase (GGDEF)-like protein/PAS domain S-box-containing protein
MINRLVPAWLTKDFSGVADILTDLGSSQPESVWSPDRDELPDARLRAMHDVWRAQAGAAALPADRLCVPAAFGELVEIMMFLEFEDDGQSLRYLHYGKGISSFSGTNWTGKTTVDLANYSENSLIYASSYLAAAILREALYNEFLSSPKLEATTWCRYLLPYIDDEGKVSCFACANLPIPGVPHWTAPRGSRPDAAETRPAVAGVADGAAALATMEKNVREILAASPIAIMVVAPNAVLINYANSPLGLLLGREASAMSTTRPKEIFAEPSEFERYFAESLTGKQLRNVEVRLIHHDGSSPWALMSTHSVVFNGTPSIAFWFFDISDRKAAEEALHESERQKEATILRLEEAQENLRRLADRDILTNVPNRRYFQLMSSHEFERARRSSSSLCLLMIDIDRFKRVNDVYGHQAGDAVLSATAAVLDGAKRKADILARFGGEEFVVLLPETATPGAFELAEKLRSSVALAPVSWRDHELAITISIGVGTLTAADATIDSLIARADAALYEAKRLGRNRVEGGLPRLTLNLDSPRGTQET